MKNSNFLGRDTAPTPLAAYIRRLDSSVFGARLATPPPANVPVALTPTLSGARCIIANGPADATATHCLLLLLIQIGLTFLVPGHPGSPGQKAVKRMCVSKVG